MSLIERNDERLWYGIVAADIRRDLTTIPARALELMRAIEAHPKAGENAKRTARRDALSTA